MSLPAIYFMIFLFFLLIKKKKVVGLIAYAILIFKICQ